MVLVAGVEPAHPKGRGILSPLRLPIPPHEHFYEGKHRFGSTVIIIVFLFASFNVEVVEVLK